MTGNLRFRRTAWRRYPTRRLNPLGLHRQPFLAVAILGFSASLFPLRELSDFVSPAERYGASGDGATIIYESDPTRPISRWKEAWESAKLRAGVSCPFHDLRHTGCTRMLEAGVPFSVVATIMGWSASTTVRMEKRYGHIEHNAQRLPVDAPFEPVF